MKKVVILVLAMTLISECAFAESTTNITSFGPGAGISCGTYLSSSPTNTETMMIWALGFLTGVNATHYFGTTDILLTTDFGAIKANIFNYCQKNPLDKFALAVQQTAVDLAAQARKK